jgi:prohibitin 2
MTDETTTQAAPAKPKKTRGGVLAFWMAFFGTAIFLLYLLPDILFPVQPGEAAVVWHRFWGGTDTDDVYREGTHVQWPWDKVYIYDVRLQHLTQDMTVLSTDGLEVHVSTTTRFRVIPDHLGILHTHVGPNYKDTVLVPEIGAHVRNVVGRYDPEQLYTTRRELIQDEILDLLRRENQLTMFAGAALRELIYIEDVLVLGIRLPEKVEAAIEQKLTQRHEMLEYDYRIQKEEKEKQRKTIEAEGIRQFQDIVTEGISDRYLKWKGIDATLELAKSPNAKMVIIGNSQDGLPLILGPLESGPSGTPPPRPAPAPGVPGTPPPAAPTTTKPPQ